ASLAGEISLLQRFVVFTVLLALTGRAVAQSAEELPPGFEAPARSALVPDAAFAPADSQPFSEYVPEEPPSSPYAGAIMDRPRMFGNWWGARDALLERGLNFDISSTQFYQGVASGGIDQTFAYGGRNDYLLKLEGEKAGLWKGFYINL